MSDIFISYARSTATQAQTVAEALRALGYQVWLDDQLPAHRAYADVIQERLKAAKAVVVIWSADAAKSEWVRSEASVAREAGTLVQSTVDKSPLPMPFDQIECADLRGWTCRADSPGWRKVVESVTDLVGKAPDHHAAPVASQRRSAPASPWVRAATGATIVVVAIASLLVWGPLRPAPVALGPMRSVAILPVRNLTDDPSLDAVADTLTEDTIDVVGRSGLIMVTPRETTFALKGKPIDEQLLGRQLHVRYLVAASLRKSAPGYRVMLQIVDTTSGQLVGAKDLGSVEADASLAERQLALKLFSAIADVVVGRWVDAELARPPDDHDPDNILARLQKLHEDNRRSDIEKAEALIAAGRTRIPKDNPIWPVFLMTACDYDSGLIDAGYETSPAQRAAWATAALNFGAEAAELKPDATGPHVCRAVVYGQLEQWDQAMAEARHVIQIFPLTADGYGALANLEFAQGRFADALTDFTEFGARTEGDPADLGITHLFLGNYGAAIEDLRESAVVDPEEPRAPFFLAAALELSGRHDDAISEARIYRRLKTGGGVWRILARSHEPAFLGPARAIRQALHDAGLDEPGAGPAAPTRAGGATT
ncbi:MAG TPA: TIR domain-containing protein [Caulobacteraceae bacterium]|nr:TIR domain-containing protein [Caulobacteraceae bacterium]